MTPQPIQRWIHYFVQAVSEWGSKVCPSRWYQLGNIKITWQRDWVLLNLVVISKSALLKQLLSAIKTITHFFFNFSIQLTDITGHCHAPGEFIPGKRRDILFYVKKHPSRCGRTGEPKGAKLTFPWCQKEAQSFISSTMWGSLRSHILDMWFSIINVIMISIVDLQRRLRLRKWPWTLCHEEPENAGEPWYFEVELETQDKNGH